MGINTMLGKKIEQSQEFLKDGTRIPVTKVEAKGNIVVSIKKKKKDGYSGVLLGFGEKKNPNKAILGLAKKANLKFAPYFLREVKVADSEISSIPAQGSLIKPLEIFKPGDIVDVSGTSKGKGFAGVVKRHHFKGGPRTHGQSDRERAPGSIGQTTTPGRVYKGKRMAGRMGQERVTVKNLTIVGVGQDHVVVKGLVPGSVKSFVTIKKVGEDKKFVPLYKEVEKAEKVAKGEESAKK